MTTPYSSGALSSLQEGWAGTTFRFNVTTPYSSGALSSLLETLRNLGEWTNMSDDPLFIGSSFLTRRNGYPKPHARRVTTPYSSGALSSLLAEPGVYLAGPE